MVWAPFTVLMSEDGEKFLLMHLDASLVVLRLYRSVFRLRLLNRYIN